jgi:hypothetical protein
LEEISTIEREMNPIVNICELYLFSLKNVTKTVKSRLIKIIRSLNYLKKLKISEINLADEFDQLH